MSCVIGKSVFACFLLYRLRQDYAAASILYVDHKRAGQNAFLLPAAGAAVQQGSSLSPFYTAAAANRSGFAVLDQGQKSIAPAVINTQAIVLSSLDNKHFKDFVGAFHNYAVMPSWEREECSEAYQLLYAPQQLLGMPPPQPHILADWETRFDQLGGVPRWVFDDTRAAAAVVEKFNSELPKYDDIKALLQTRAINQISAGKGSRLVTYEVDERGDANAQPPVLPTFKEIRWRWISDRVGEQAMQIIQHGDETAGARLLFNINHSDERSAFGAAFESWAHLQLAKGGKFRTRPVGAFAPGGEVQLQPTNTVWYSANQEATVPNQVSPRA